MYLYPQNLRANANLWLWSLKDFSMISIACLVSVIALDRRAGCCRWL